MARLYNPTNEALEIATPRQLTDQYGQTIGSSVRLEPRAIATLAMDAPEAKAAAGHPASVTILNWPEYPAGPDNSKPDPDGMAQLELMHQRLKGELDSLTAILEAYGEDAPSRLQHRYYVIARECMEAQLSLLWNHRRAERDGAVTEEYATHVDAEIYKLATEYNDIRIMRRMYDYIIDIDTKGEAQVLPRTAVKS